MTTPDKTRSVGETDVSARPVSEERLSYLIAAHADPENWGYSVDTVTALRELQSLRAEVRGLREVLGRRGKSDMPLIAARARMAVAEARNASLEKDAGRYRWLRSEESGMDDITQKVPNIATGSVALCLLSGYQLDAAIDAAMEPATGSVKEGG